MGLQTRLDAMRAEFVNNADPAVLEKMKHASRVLEEPDHLAFILKVGERAPDFTLNDAGGKAVSSQALLEKGPLLVSFYRGVWWPYCNAELEALQAVLPDIGKTGTTLVAISPMRQKYAPQLVQKLRLTFPLLSDPGNRVAEGFGVVYTLPNGLKEIYKELGIDLERFNGDDAWRLPMPGRVVIDTEGIIRDIDIHPDHTTRPEPEETVDILRDLISRS